MVYIYLIVTWVGRKVICFWFVSFNLTYKDARTIVLDIQLKSCQKLGFKRSESKIFKQNKIVSKTRGRFDDEKNHNALHYISFARRLVLRQQKNSKKSLYLT